MPGLGGAEAAGDEDDGEGRGRGCSRGPGAPGWEDSSVRGMTLSRVDAWGLRARGGHSEGHDVVVGRTN